MDFSVFLLIISAIFQCVVGKFQISVPKLSEALACKVDLVTDDEWEHQKIFQEHIKDTSVNKIIFSSKYRNEEIKINGCSSTDCYFSVDIKDGNLTIFANENLTNIDGEYKWQQPSRQIPTTIGLVCDGTKRDFRFSVTIDDTNNHAPAFEKESYKFSLPMPLPSTINLMQFGEAAIKVNDIDFSNENIQFTSDLEGLTYTTEIDKDAKFPYSLNLKFNKFTKLNKDTTFTLNATDSGTPKLSTEVKVTFLIDEEHSEPYIPVYKRPSFLYKYDAYEGSLVAEEKVEMEETEKKIKCEINDKMKQYFHDPVVENTEVDISLNGKLPETITTNKTAVQATIFCHVEDISDQGASADIVISIPDDVNEKSVGFSKSAYTATYTINKDDKTHVFQMNDKIKIENPEEVADVTIQVEENFEKYFQCKEENDYWDITKIKDLDQNLLTDLNLNIFINLMVKNEYVDKAIVAITLPNAEGGIHFDLPVYQGKYTYGEDDAELEINIMSLNSQFVKSSTCEIEGEYGNEYFDVEPNGSSSFKLSKKKDKLLPSKILEKGMLLLTLEVELKLKTTSQLVQTMILLNLVAKDDPKSTTVNPTSSRTLNPTSSTENVCPTEAPDNDDDCSVTVWIIVTIVLIIILILFVGGSLLFYFKKLRQKKQSFPSYQQRIEPHLQRKLSLEKYKDVSTRRPTGYIRYNPDLDKEEDQFGEVNEETNNNTEANRNIPPPLPETFNRIPESQKNVSFGEASEETQPPPMTLAEELMQAVKERESRLI